MCTSSAEDLVLTPDEELAIQNTWELVQADLKGNGVKFFLHFFHTFPEYQRKFRGFCDVPLFELAENKRLKAHAFTVMSAINGMVDNLDDVDVLNELLLKTGENHAKRKLQTGDFQNLRESLLEFLEMELGERYTPIAETAWKKVLTIMVSKIDEGIESFHTESPKKT